MTAIESESELLVADPGGHRAVTVDVEVRGDADQHPLSSLRHTGEGGDLDGRIQHDAPDPASDRGATESSVVVGVGRHWPNRRVESRRSRKAYRRQDVRQS